MNGFVFVGEIVEGKVEAIVYFNDNMITMGGRVWFTLDEWLKARDMTEGNDEIWVATMLEYEETLAVETRSVSKGAS